MADWYLDRNGKPTGPFSREALEQMLAANLITLQNKVWKAGYEHWHVMSNTAEFGGEPDSNRYDLADDDLPALPRRGVTVARGAMTPGRSGRGEADLDALASMVDVEASKQAISADARSRVIATGQMTLDEKSTLKMSLIIGALVVVSLVVGYFVLFDSWENRNEKEIRQLATDIAYAKEMNRPQLAIATGDRLSALLQNRVLNDAELSRLVATASSTAQGYRTLLAKQADDAKRAVAISDQSRRLRERPPATQLFRSADPPAVAPPDPIPEPLPPFPTAKLEQAIRERHARENPGFTIEKIEVLDSDNFEWPRNVRISVTSPTRDHNDQLARLGTYTFRINDRFEVSPSYTFENGEDSLESLPLARIVSDAMKQMRQ